MARANGGEILIKIPKDIGDITADDFDKEFFKKVCKEQLTKKMIFCANNLTLVMTYNYISKTSCFFQSSIHEFYTIYITYEVESDILQFHYEEM